MARVMTGEQFRAVAVKGTVFAYGPKWSFGKPFVFLQHVPPSAVPDCWGFWASDPCWPESGDIGDAFDVLDRCLQTGEAFDVETTSTKFMNYDSDLDDAVFMVFEEADILRLVQDWWPSKAKAFDKRITPL